MKLSIHLHCLGILLPGIRKNVNLCNTTQLTLKEQGLEPCVSTYKKILFFFIINTVILVEKAMATQSSTLAWKIPWTEEPGRLQSMGSLRVTEGLHFHFSLRCIGEGNGNPFLCSCLENPRDVGAWWAAIYGFTQNRTR